MHLALLVEARVDARAEDDEERQREQEAFYDKLYREAEARAEMRDRQVREQNNDPECTFSPNLSKKGAPGSGGRGSSSGGKSTRRRRSAGGMSPHERLYKDGLDRKAEKKKQQVGIRARTKACKEIAA